MSTAKALKEAREVAMGAGFLLQKLQSLYGDQFGIGVDRQVKQAISECRRQAMALTVLDAVTNTKERFK
jgi:hypothetical protein